MRERNHCHCWPDATVYGAPSVDAEGYVSLDAGSGLVLAALGVLLITGDVGVVSSWSSSLLHDVGLGTLATG